MKKIFVFILLFVAYNSIAQNYTTKKTAKGKAKTAYDEGMKLNFGGQNDKALKKFGDALREDPTFIDAQIQWAAMQQVLENLPEAEKGFEQALKIDATYDPKVLYVLGNIKMQMEKFDKAIELFHAYTQAPTKTHPDLIAKALRNVDDCRLRWQALKNPVPFKPELLRGKVNTPDNAEYLPSLSADGETLVFTRLIERDEDLYLSRRDTSGAWGEPIPLSNINTPDYNEGAQTISADGKTILLTICDKPGGKGNCDIYISQQKANGEWTPPTNMGLPINLNSWDAQPSLSADGRALYFATERKGVVGGKDIFVSFKNEFGTWSLPKSVGDSINTAGDDQAPFIHPDGQTLYFTSDGHPNFGKRDLYFSRLQKDGKWGKPQNLGFPINTKESEGTLIVSLDGKMAYFTKSIDGGKHDLYQFELYEAARPQPVTYSKIIVTDAVTGEPLRATTEVQDLATQNHIYQDLTDTEGAALICMTIGKNYSLEVSKEGYLFHSENFNLSYELKDSISIDKPFKINIKLRKIGDKIAQQNLPTEGGNSPSNPTLNSGEAVILRNVFFETGSAALRPESTTELMRLKDLLEKNNVLKIEIQGHTDNVGNDNDNQKLSQNRAKAVYDFLVKQGISANRLTYKGFGESQPIAPNSTPQGRLLNRRTAFVVK